MIVNSFSLYHTFTATRFLKVRSTDSMVANEFFTTIFSPLRGF
jgi:hypothetical protein